METLRVPLYGQISTRQHSTGKDQRFKNCYPEQLKTGSDKPLSYVIKRPGFSDSATTAVAAGRGLYTWDGSHYAVVANKVYKDGSVLTGTLNNSTGRAHFTEVKGGTARLVIQDGDDIWTVTAAGTLAESGDVDIPANQVPGIVNIDGYVCVMNTDNEIYHFDVNDPTALDPLSKITASLEPDDGKAIIKHLNYVVALNEWSTEFFYDAGNGTGSVLSKVDGSTLRYGCAEGNTAVSFQNVAMWVGKDKSGGKNVILLEGLTPEVVSTKPIERLIDAEENNITTAYAYSMRIAGHVFYVLTLKTTAITLVYDIIDKTWHEWNSDDGSTETYFTGVDHCELLNKHYILDEDNGKIYEMDVDIYQDSGNDINVEVVTNKVDFATDKMTFCHKWRLIGDEQTSTSNVTVDWSDDDYQSWSTSRTLDMSKTNPALHALGAFVRRAFRMKHTANTPLRLEAMEFGADQGTYGAID